MNLKLGIVLERKPNMNNLDSIVEEILYPYLSTTPTKELILQECTKNEMKDKYKLFKEDYYKGVSFKKRKEDMINKGIDTFNGFCKNQHGIIRFNNDGEAVISFNPKAFIDEYKVNEVKRVKEFDENYLSMYLKTIIDKNLNVHHRELQVYRRTPSIIIKPIIDSLKKTDYIIIVDYIF